MSEEWRQVRDLDYEVSSYGRVRRRSRPETVLKPQRYVYVSLLSKGKPIRPPVHRLVAEAFLGQPPSPEESDVNHKDGDHANNRIENLEWTDSRANQLHAIATGLYAGRGQGHGRAKLTDGQVHEIRRRWTGVYGDQSRLAREFGVSQSLIAKIVRGDVWTHLEDCPTVPIIVPKGFAHGAKLTEDQVRQIREKYGGGYGQQTALARECGVPVSVVRKVLRGESWKQLKGTRFYCVPEGAKHGRAKLTENQVRWMRHLHEKGATISVLAKRYGVTRPIARDIVSRKTWKHLQ